MADHAGECVDEARCQAMVRALEECDVESARALLWHVAQQMGWEPDELIGLDVDEMPA